MSVKLITLLIVAILACQLNAWRLPYVSTRFQAKYLKDSNLDNVSSPKEDARDIPPLLKTESENVKSLIKDLSDGKVAPDEFQKKVISSDKLITRYFIFYGHTKT